MMTLVQLMTLECPSVLTWTLPETHPEHLPHVGTALLVLLVGALDDVEG